MTPTCSTCLFFSKNPKEINQGFCRFNPPTAFYVMNNLASAQPPVQPEGWCGQHVELPLTSNGVIQ